MLFFEDCCQFSFLKNQCCSCHCRVALFRMTSQSLFPEGLGCFAHMFLSDLHHMAKWYPRPQFIYKETWEYIALKYPANNWIYGSKHFLIFFLKCSVQQTIASSYHCGRCASFPSPLCLTTCIRARAHKHTHVGERRELPMSVLGGSLSSLSGLVGGREPLWFSCLFPFHFPPYSAVSLLSIRV